MNTKTILENIIFSTDAYKLTHIDQYPTGTTTIFSSLFARGHSDNPLFKSDKTLYVKHLKYILDQTLGIFDDFFNLNRDELSLELELIDKTLNKFIDSKHVSKQQWLELYDLKTLPLEIYYVKDDSTVFFNSPLISIFNTNPKFFWLVNFLETKLLSNSWQLLTSLNISKKIYELLDEFKNQTHNEEIIYQAHDFSYRGHSSKGGAILSGVGHLTFFKGTDNLPAFNEYLKFNNNQPQIKSIPASEHSIMILEGEKNEQAIIEDLIKTYEHGAISVVADSYDYINFLTNVLPKVKQQLLNSKTKLIIRPDSGEGVAIVTKTIKILEDIFGTTTNAKGYKELHPQVGIIYGDGIDFEKIKAILIALKNLNYSTNNIVFGVGTKIYQRNSRDTLGFVYKTSYALINGKGKSVHKKPKTNLNKTSPAGIIFTNLNGEIDNSIKDLNKFESTEKLMLKYFD